MNGRIDSRLAAQIVEQATKVLPFDVNVMDAKGSVVASTDPSRVGSFHRGAQMVLGSASEVEIDHDAAARIPNTRPGVNLPLFVRERLVGVIGLTGAPADVRQFGKLLQSMAQLILERDELTLELQREEHHKEEFVRQAILGSSHLSSVEVAAWAARVGIDLELTRSALICQFDPGQFKPDTTLAELDRIRDSISRECPHLIATRVSMTDLAIFGSVVEDPSSPGRTEENARRLLADVRIKIGGVCKTSFRLALGIALPAYEGLRQSWTSAVETLRIGMARARSPDEYYFSYYDHRLAVLLCGLTETWRTAEFSRPLELLLTTERDGPLLLHTLKVWFEQGAQPKLTAEALGIHRNTLDYRLKKIKEATGLDLSRVDDFVMVYIALQRMGE
ncbi:transcriptional regulator [Caballeronia calidae]|uniref:Transcriptional regulator n=1 Tax=Caballeronia calidae TaxID=1777139 RepID=A0A158E9Z3_9BURK|nr:sugar diacid recognition domain-containing protein [Caballeronia calidae]SAL03668.1 transcriptional regulator [Caballeronia calidae]